MKKLFPIFWICILGYALYAASWVPILKTVASASVPEQLSTSDTRYRTIVIVGNKTARGTNTSRVWIQSSATNDEGGFYLESGERMSIESQGQGVSPSEIWIDVITAGDGLSATCIP